jgi:RHS repeat-associated protein
MSSPDGDDSITYQYDNEGNLTSRFFYDTDSKEEYTYDHRNRLTSVTIYGDSYGPVIERINYTYDAQGRLVKRVVDPDGDTGSQPLETETYVYDGSQLAMSFTKTGSAAATLEHRYLYGPADQVLVDEVFNAAGQSTETLWLLGDQQGTPRDIVDDNGILRQHTEYDSFGNITAQQTYGTAIEELFGYTGQRRDKSTGLYNMLQRWYDPRTGRWLSEDPIGFDAGDPNLYRYVGNSPINGYDPTGLIQAGNPLTNLNLFAGGYSGGTVAPAKPTNSFVATGFKNIFGGISGAVNSVGSAIGSAIGSVATPFHSAIDTATYFAAANEWLSHEFIADGTFGGGAYRGGKYLRDQGTSVSTQLELFNFYAGQQPSFEGSTRSGLVSFGSALFNQPAIQANVSAGLVAYGKSRERSFANLWDTVKLWDNQVVAQNVANLVDQGSSISGAVYGGVGTAIGDNVGVSGVYSAYEGKGFYGSNLSGWDRTLQGGLGGAQLVGTAFGLKAPVTAGARAAYNVGTSGVKSLGSFSLDIGANLQSVATSYRLQFDPATFSTGGLGGVKVVRVGQQGEAIATQLTGAVKNTQKFAVLGRNIIPDFNFAVSVNTRLPVHIGEAKNVAYQSLTKQLRNQAALVGQNGRADIFLPPNAKVSGPLQRAFDEPGPLTRQYLIQP